ncbi:MAG: cell envelope integrity protein TolA [Ruminococcus flavefaciens]|nr:cell envelope integrity protein TolA [Ruminococcus flavefaciens]MCM1228963.1 cell envelope integrity protein TolA [Ruminococcus flavefaciens]
MATKKDLDNIINNGKSAKNGSSSTVRTHGGSGVDNMSVDDLLTTFTDSKSAIKSDAPRKLAPLPPKTSGIKPAGSKKRIVITNELPDYDALREQEKEKQRLEAERKAQEEAERQRLEAERKAKEEAERQRLEAERKAKEEAERKRLEAERKAKEEAERQRIEAEETKRRLLDSAEDFTVEEITEIKNSEEYDDEYDDYELDDDSDPVGSMINNIREDAEKAVADIENSVNSDDDGEDDESPDDSDEADIEASSFGISAVLEDILDENPEEIINERSEKPESDKAKKPKLKLKKNIYTLLGLVFAVLACVGLVTVISKSVSLIGGFSSGNSKKNGFESIVYPAVIMDIESFESPAELSSEQVITASIWSMIMSENAISKYEMTFDVVKIPAVDVESYAVKLFGENLPVLNHTTVGPAESRFYYNEETKSYNVPIAPVTYTYSPEIKGATKSGDTYTIVVDYIDELPEWLPKASSKSVEFKLTETNDGYIINSMKVLSTTKSAL